MPSNDAVRESGDPPEAGDAAGGTGVPVLDLSMKLLCRQAPAAMLRLAGVEVEPHLVRLDDTSIVLPELRADNVLHVEEPDDPFSVVVEYQGQPNRERLLTWILETLALERTLRHEVFLVVIYLRRGDRATFPDGYRSRRGGLVKGVEFTAVRLWECGARLRSEGLEELAPLLVLCEETPTEATIREEIERIGRAPREKQAELLAIAYLLGTRHFLRDVLNELFGEGLSMLKDAGIISDWIAEGEARGRQEGEARGRQEGEARGRQEGETRGRAAEARRFLLRLVQRRFGEVPASLVQEIEAADPERCEELAERAIECESLSELFERPS